jgi:Mg-chelatase subunit ChlD
MNDDLNQFTIEHELQVRLLNLVVDEASDYDRDQLMHLMEQRPELKLYVEHLQHMHGLLATVGAGDWNKEPTPETSESEWKLPEDRRNKLLAILDGKSETESPAKTITLATPIVKNKRLSYFIRLAVVAASICVIATVLLLPAQYAARQSARKLRFGPDVSGGTPNAYYLDSSVEYSEASRNVAPASPAITAPAFPPPSSSSPVTVPDGGTIMLGGIKREANGRVTRGSEQVLQEEFAKQNIGAFDKPGDAPRIAGDAGKNNLWDKSSSFARDDFQDAKKAAPANGADFFGRGLAESTTNGPVAGKQLDLAEKGLSDREKSETIATDPMPATDRIDNLLNFAQSPATPSSGDVSGGTSNDFRTDGDTASMGYGGMSGGMGGMGGGSGGGRAEGYGADPGTGSGYGAGMGGMNWQVRGEGGYGDPANPENVTGHRENVNENVVDYSSVPMGTRAAGSEALQDNIPNFDSSQLSDWASLSEKRRRRDLSLSAQDPPTQTNLQENKEAARTADELLRLDAKELNGRLAEQQSQSPSEGKQLNNFRRRISDSQIFDSTLMMTVTPRIIIPEEEEEKIVAQTEERFGDATKTPSEPMYRFVAPKLEKAAESDKVELSREPKLSLGVEAKGKQVQPAKPIAPVREIAASADPFSTFSLHVSDVSFQLAQSALSQGQWPAQSTLRPEEFLNAFDYQDPTPNDAEMVACQMEQATHPFQMQRNLLRIAMKTGASGRALNMPLRLTVLLDVSGSMERHDRKLAIQKAFQALASQLRDQDQITLIAFANTPRLIADRYNVEQSKTLTSVIEKTPSQGGTNIEAALTLAREKAREQFVNGGQNRIVMLTDGAVNLGNADPNSLSKQIVELRNEGIAFDAAGICAQDLNDEILEALTRQGDGRYYLINSDDSTAESFSKQLAGALRPTAKNVKVQVEFNPQRVGQYRLIGFEKHQLKKEDFRNDQVDAAELAAAEAGVAMYQVEVKPDGIGDVGSVSVRFQDVSTGQMVERRWPITYNAKTPSVDTTKPTMQLATAATLFALKLKGEPSTDRIDFSMLSGLVSSLPSGFANQPRVQALLTMINQARSLGEPPQVGN